MSKELIIWAAGLFDGEGSIFISRSKSRNKTIPFTLTVALGMTHEDSVRRFHSIFKVGSITNILVKREKWKDKYNFQAVQYDAIKIIEELFPYLFTKKLQAELALEYGEKCLSLNGKCFGRWNEIPDKIRDLREIIADELQELNKTGK